MSTDVHSRSPLGRFPVLRLATCFRCLRQRGTLQAVTSDQCFKTPASPCSYWQNWWQHYAALRANDPDTFKRWLYGGIQDLGEPAVTELLLDWIDPFITRVERDRIVAWHLGVSL